MQSDCILDNGKAQSRSAKFAAAAFIHTVEALEDARKMLIGDSCTIIGKSKVVVLLICTEAGNLYESTLPCISNRIVNQITEYRIEH